LGEFLNMTIIDPLTEIYNRRFFDGNMNKIIKSLSRTGSKLSLLMIDIDFFKKYNDTYGHDMGDNCLRKVAAVFFKSIIREEDFVARYGGEEFVVVLPNTDENGMARIAEKLLRNIRECNIPHKNSSVANFITVSIGGTTGIVKYSQNESDYVKRADTALYQSKQNGRNQFNFIPLEG
jgi:diguanylate cyclase (GGDEF)-like protein